MTNNRFHNFALLVCGVQSDDQQTTPHANRFWIPESWLSNLKPCKMKCDFRVNKRREDRQKERRLVIIWLNSNKQTKKKSQRPCKHGMYILQQTSCIDSISPSHFMLRCWSASCLLCMCFKSAWLADWLSSHSVWRFMSRYRCCP